MGVGGISLHPRPGVTCSKECRCLAGIRCELSCYPVAGPSRDASSGADAQRADGRSGGAADDPPGATGAPSCPQRPSGSTGRPVLAVLPGFLWIVVAPRQPLPGSKKIFVMGRTLSDPRLQKFLGLSTSVSNGVIPAQTPPRAPHSVCPLWSPLHPN